MSDYRITVTWVKLLLYTSNIKKAFTAVIAAIALLPLSLEAAMRIWRACYIRTQYLQWSSELTCPLLEEGGIVAMLVKGKVCFIK